MRTFLVLAGCLIVFGCSNNDSSSRVAQGTGSVAAPTGKSKTTTPPATSRAAGPAPKRVVPNGAVAAVPVQIEIRPVSPGARARIDDMRKRRLRDIDGEVMTIKANIETLNMRRGAVPDPEALMAQYNASLAELDRERGEINRNDPSYVPTLPLELELGLYGRLDHRKGRAYKVIQILNDHEAAVKTYSIGVDFRNQPVETASGDSFVIKGVSTRDMEEGWKVDLPQVFEVTGNRRIASGAAFVLEAVTLDGR